jgi:succinate dehydrogenase/fumarate reductase-like Fe-S protein
VVNEEKWKLFSGPSALVQLGKYALDPRDSRDAGSAAFAQGINNCDKCYACERSCPANIQIVHVIERLQQSARKSSDRNAKSLINMIEGSI